MTRWWAWLRRLFGLEETRDTLRLSSSSEGGRSADQVSEKIRRKGPLKEKGRRQIVRDERLMPKPGRANAWTKPAKVMSESDATRLFAGTLRTSNRQLRTLDWDEAQLKRYGLPAWRTEADVAAALGVSVGSLRHFSTHRQRERVTHWVTFGVRKRSGGVRLIHAPKKKLKAVLRKMNELLVAKLPVSTHAHGFVAGRSVKTGAVLHVAKPVLLRMDLKDFFPTVTSHRVRGLLVHLGYGYAVAASLAVLMTEAERQPVEIEGVTYFVPVGPRVCVQGAPTSPGVCNAMLLRLDRRLAGLAVKRGFVYSRYADDLTFSGPSEDAAHALRRAAERVIVEEGFVVNVKKTRVMGQGGRQMVTGVTVNAVLGLSRQKRRRIRAAIHQGKLKGAELQGTLAWVSMLNPSQAASLSPS